MDHIRILRRALDITRNYRVLWLFGILVALTTSRGGGNGGGGGGGNGSDGGSGGGFPPFPTPPMPDIPSNMLNTMIGVGIAILCGLILLGVVFTIVRYVGSTALIRMVDRFETTGEKLSFKEGWRLGWSRVAFRAWLVDFLVGLAVLLLVIVMALVAAAPLLVWLGQQETLHVIGTIAAIGLGLLFIFVLVLVGALLGVLGEFFRRSVVLENLGVREGIRRGWELARRKPGDIIVMALILFGLGLGIGLLMIPLVIMLVIFGGMAGGLPALATWAITNAFSEGALPVILAVLVGLPIFILILAIPLSIINGLIEVFTSSTWTLTFRETRLLDAIRGEPSPIEPAV